MDSSFAAWLDSWYSVSPFFFYFRGNKGGNFKEKKKKNIQEHKGNDKTLFETDVLFNNQKL